MTPSVVGAMVARVPIRDHAQNMVHHIATIVFSTNKIYRIINLYLQEHPLEDLE
jgi:hypothetical protein